MPSPWISRMMEETIVDLPCKNCGAHGSTPHWVHCPSRPTPSNPDFGVADLKLTVKVEALNDDGERRFAFGEGEDTSEAVAQALGDIREETGDDSFEMTEWWAT